MNLRKPVIAALVAGIMFLLWLGDRHFTRSSTVRDVREARLIYFDAVDATGVELKNRHGRFVLEKRGGDTWWLVEPVEVLADQGQVEAMIDNMMGARKADRFKADDLSRYGLENPSPIITIIGNVGTEEQRETILLGSDANRPGRIYGMIEDNNEVFSTGDWVRSHTLRDLDLLRDKRILRVDPDGVESIALKTRDGSTLITKTNRFVIPWEIRELSAPAETRFVERILANLSQAPATQIIDSPTTSTAELGLVEPPLTVQLETIDGSMSLVIGERDGDEWYATSSTQPGVITLRTRYISDLLQPASAWKSTRFLWHAPEKWKRVRTLAGNSEMNLVRGENSLWLFEESPDLPVDPRKLQVFFKALADLSANPGSTAPVADERDIGVREGTYRVEITCSDGSIEGFAAGKVNPSEGIQWLLRLQDQASGTIQAEDYHRTFAFRKDLQDRRVLSAFASQVAKVEMAFPKILGSSRTHSLINETGTWKIRSPAGRTFVPSPDAVAFFLEASESLEWDGLAVLKDEEPERIFRFLDGDDELIAEIETYTDKDGNLFVKASGRVFYPVERVYQAFDLSLSALLSQNSETSGEKNQ